MITESQKLSLLAAITRGDCLHTSRFSFCQECRDLLYAAVKAVPVPVAEKSGV